MTDHGQPARGETGIRGLVLRFSPSDLEAEFRRMYVGRFLTQIRVALLLALVLYATFGALDPFVVPNAVRFAWILRYAIGCPLIALTFALSFTRQVERWIHAAVVFLSLMVGISIIAIMWVDGSPSSHQYYAGLMLVSIYLYSFVRLPFVPATVTGWSLMTVYEIGAWSTGVVPTPVLVSNSIFLLSINSIGMSACYWMERSSRVDFLQQRLIDRQAEGLRRALSDLEARNAELDSFVYSASHDLKSPLVTIAAMTAMLREDYGERLDDAGRHLLQRVEANARQMEHLIFDLLTLSRVGREPASPECVAVHQVVSRLVEDFTASIRSGVQIAVSSLPSLWARPVHVEQVFGNLVGNAFKYLGDGPNPTIEIGAIDHPDVVEFYVRDSGIGIEPTYHAKVFDIFERLQDADTAGTGVGLAIVKRIIETNGGRIWVESRKGCGATFRFTWPKHPADPNAPPAALPATQAPANGRLR